MCFFSGRLSWLSNSIGCTVTLGLVIHAAGIVVNTKHHMIIKTQEQTVGSTVADVFIYTQLMGLLWALLYPRVK